MRETVRASGHPNISARHRTTAEITKEGFLTPAGDCIIGIRADRSLPELSDSLKDSLRRGAGLRIILECNGARDTITARGDPRLTLKDSTSMVIRKSSFVCPRTLCVRADKAAADLDRKLVKELRKGEELKAMLEV